MEGLGEGEGRGWKGCERGRGGGGRVGRGGREGWKGCERGPPIHTTVT